MKTFTGILLAVLGMVGMRAEVELNRLFCDDMVLQQETRNAVWGWADPGEEVSVSASWGASEKATADPAGKWKVMLDTPAHGTGHRITVEGKNRIVIDNVAIGEVWICMGQSNLGWKLGGTYRAEEALAEANAPDYRIFKSAVEHWHEPLEKVHDRLSRWKPCTPESAEETSAVAYLFGKKLHDELGIPVGIIQQAYAGTPIEGWMPWEIQKDDPRTQAHKEDLDNNAERQLKQGETVEKALADFYNELEQYNASVAAGIEMENRPPRITKPATLGHQYPGHMFNALVYPIIPYGMRGIMWYQGERNSKDVPQAQHYRFQLAQLIQFYRELWHGESGGNVPADFPFQFTQLPSWNPPQSKPVEGLEASWAVNRESMRLVTNDIPNTGMVVSIDTGDPVELHPKNKRPVGLRHAYLALKHTYGRDIVGEGPRFRKQTVQGNRIILEFDSVGSGLVTVRPGKADAFAIAGKDKVWRWADAEITGDTVVVSSQEVMQPVAVRYAWALNPSQRNLLYNKEGFPASPFRTDDWPLFDPDAPIVDVIKPEKPKGYEPKDWYRPEMNP